MGKFRNLEYTGNKSSFKQKIYKGLWKSEYGELKNLHKTSLANFEVKNK